VTAQFQKIIHLCPCHMSTLTESDIKRAFLPFLRQFYRFRYEYQPASEQASFDNVTAEGYIADGLLTFLKPDGSRFVCTYEATSADKIQEVKYAHNQDYFLWDCLAFAGVVAVIGYCYIFLTSSDTLRTMGTAGKIGLPLGVGMIGFFGWYFLMKSWKKYRYVYAIEQFKRYHADEQWVAIGEDVFPAPTDPYFLELKDQCIYHGFGLAIVQFNEQIRLVAAPSRLGVYGGKRRMAHWLTDTQLFQSIATNVQAAARFAPPVPGPIGRLRTTLTRPLHRYIWQPLQRTLGQPAVDFYQRFTGTYLIQKIVLATSIGLLVILVARAIQYREVEDITEYSPKIYEPPKRTAPNPEHQDGYLRRPDDEPIIYGETQRTGVYTGVPRQETQAKEEEIPEIDLSSGDDDEPEPTKTTRSTSTSVKSVGAAKPQSEPADRCAAIRQAGGWIVQDNVFSTKAFANERVNELRKAGITCEILEASCLKAGSGYIVKLGFNVPKAATARAKAAAYSETIAKAGLSTGKTIIRSVKPQATE
jgi:cell division septation protein DedD